MLDNWFYIIPNVFFGILLLLAIRRFKKNTFIYGKNYLPFFIISLYFISASFIYFVKPESWYPYFHKSSYTPFNFTVYSFFLFLFLLPALYLKPVPKKALIPSSKFVNWLMVLMAFLGLFSFFYQLPYGLKGFFMRAADIRFQMNTENTFILPKSPLTTLAVGISYFYLFYIAFFFISIIQNKTFIIKLSLLVGSLSYVVSGMAFATRDVFVFYILGFLFVYFYLYNILPKFSRRNVKIFFTAFTILLIAELSNISYQRFAHRTTSDSMSYGTIGYIAQQPFVFSETVEQQREFYNGNLRFPLIVSIIGTKKELDRKYHYEWSFGTFIKDFYAEGGFVFLILITILLVSMFFIKIRHSYKNNFFRNLIITLFYFQFMSMGIFYFKLGSRAGNIYMLILLLFYFLTYFKYGKKKRVFYA